MPNPIRKDERTKGVEAWSIAVSDLTVLEGWNPRRIDKPSTQEKIERMAQSYRDGRPMPDLLVRYEKDTTIRVVDGHCRLSAAKLAMERGWVPPTFRLQVREVKGNDGELMALALRTGDVSDPLTPMEIAEGYRRLRGQGYDDSAMADMTGRPVAYVRKHLSLADAPKDLQDLVDSGAVSVSTLLELRAKQSDEQVRTILAEGQEKAKAAGRERVRPADVREAGARSFKRYVPKEFRPHLESLKAAVADWHKAIQDECQQVVVIQDDDKVEVPYRLLRPLLEQLGSPKETGAEDLL